MEDGRYKISRDRTVFGWRSMVMREDEAFGKAFYHTLS
jgi:hypothetical protein